MTPAIWCMQTHMQAMYLPSELNTAADKHCMHSTLRWGALPGNGGHGMLLTGQHVLKDVSNTL